MLMKSICVHISESNPGQVLKEKPVLQQKAYPYLAAVAETEGIMHDCARPKNTLIATNV